MSASPATAEPARAVADPARWARLRSAAALAIALYAAAYALWRVGFAPVRLAPDALMGPLVAAPGLAALVVARAHEGRARRGWRLVAAAWLACTAGGLLAIVWRGTPGAELARRAAGFLYAAYHPLVVAGAAHLVVLPAGRRHLVAVVLDGLLVLAASCTVVWYFVLRTDRAMGLFTLPLAVGVPAVLLAVALALRGDGVRAPDVPLHALGLSCLLAALADLAGASAATPQGRAWSAVALAAAGAVLTIGALTPRERWRPAGGRFAMDVLARVAGYVPAGAAVLVCGLLVAELLARGPDARAVRGLAAGAALLTSLLVVRLGSAFRDLDREADARVAQQERLRAAQGLEVVGQLAAVVAHDFANVLAVQLATIGELRERMGDRPELADLDAATARGREMCRHLLDLARRAPAEPRVHDLRQLVDGLLPLLRRLVGRRVRVDVTGAPGALVRADATQLEIVLLNLAANARDAMPDGGSLRVDVERAPGRVRLRVSDEGCGMDAATLERARELFFTTKPRGQGTGLGLATVESAVTSVGGALAIRSRPGEGTVVDCDFPAA